MVTTKKCSKCLEVKDLTDFGKTDRTKCGRISACRDCERSRLRKYQRENRDKVRESNRKSYEKHREKRLEAQRKYADKNRVKRSEAARRRYLENREEYLEKCKKYRMENPQMNKLAKARRRDRELSLPHTLTKTELEETLSIFSNSCAICGGPYEHLDHFIPIKTGIGGTTKENIVPMCSAHNLSKSSRNPFEWSKICLTEVEQQNFHKVVQYLSETNKMTYDAYKNKVNESFK